MGRLCQFHQLLLYGELVNKIIKSVIKVTKVIFVVFHGHSCKPDGLLEPFSKETMRKRRYRHLERAKFLRSAGFVVLDVFECEIAAQIETDEELREFMRRHYPMGLSGPLRPRTAFFGGRVSAFKTFVDVEGKNSAEILLMDIVSQKVKKKQLKNTSTFFILRFPCTRTYY